MSNCPEDRFPVLGDGTTRRGYGDHPSLTVPFGAVKAHEKQAYANHHQSVERLKQRGGLSWCELAAVLRDREWRKMDLDMAHESAMRAVCIWQDQQRRAADTEVPA